MGYIVFILCAPEVEIHRWFNMYCDSDLRRTYAIYSKYTKTDQQEPKRSKRSNPHLRMLGETKCDCLEATRYIGTHLYQFSPWAFASYDVKYRLLKSIVYDLI